MKRILVLMIPGLMIAALFAALPAYGAVTTTTTHLHRTTVTFPAANPCSGVPGIVTATLNEVMRITVSPKGSHISDTMTGSFTFAQVNGVTYTGHFTAHSEGKLTIGRTSELTSTFSIHAVGSDGSTLHVNAIMHTTVGADGTPINHVMRLNCHA